MWLGDDFHHNGAFRLSYGFEYAYMMESSKEISDVTKIIDRYDAYEWYLNLGPLSNAERRSTFTASSPTWNDFVNDPDYDAFWKRQGFAAVAQPRHRADAERRRLVGPGRLLRSNQDLRTTRTSRHGEAKLSRRRSVEPRRLVERERQQTWPIDFGSPTAAHYRKNILAPFFAHYLKDKGTAERSEA